MGDVQVWNVTGQLELKTSSGGVSVIGGDGNVIAKSDFGDIEIKRRKGHLAAKTESGDILFDNPGSTTEYARTAFGDVRGLRQNVQCRRNLVSRISRREKSERTLFDF